VPNQNTGRVASLHLHPLIAGEPLLTVEQFEVVEQKGILGNPRKFGIMSRGSGKPSKRQVTLIEREQICKHAATLGLPSIPAGAVRSNIETLDVDLIQLIGREVQIGEAILLFYQARTPCEKMDRVCAGLRSLMEDGKQGVLAEVIRGGIIRIGDSINLVRT
jgi:MOSC domain-containing protein YiiM